MSNVRFVHVLAEFDCDHCGSKCLRMTRAPLVAGPYQFAIGDGERPPGGILCANCSKDDRDKEIKAYHEQRRRRAWWKRMAKKGLPDAD